MDQNGKYSSEKTFATGAQETDKAYFTSDDTSKRIAYDSGSLKTVSYTYAISTDSGITGGTIAFKNNNVSVTGGEKGDTIKVIPEANEEYELVKITAWKTENSNTKVTVNDDGTFTMPNYDVTVKAEFKKKTYAITTVTDGKGSVSALINGSKVSTAEKDATVTVSTDPKFSFYEVDSIKVYKTNDTGKTNILNNNTFTMPAEGVTIEVTFKETEQKCPVHRFFRKVAIGFSNLFS